MIKALSAKVASPKKRRCSVRIVLMLVLAVSFALPAYAQEASWNELIATAVAHKKQGRYSEAAKVAEEALTVAKKTFDPNDPAMATSLFVLAFIYTFQGKYAEAEPLYYEALAIVEDNLGRHHPHVATMLEQMARFYKKAGREDEAKRLEERAEEIRSIKQ